MVESELCLDVGPAYNVVNFSDSDLFDELAIEAGIT